MEKGFGATRSSDTNKQPNAPKHKPVSVPNCELLCDRRTVDYIDSGAIVIMRSHVFIVTVFSLADKDSV